MGNQISLEKQQLRKLVKERLSSLENKKEKSSDICKKILESSEYKDCEVVFAYIALSDEVSLSPLIEQALKDKKRVALPRIVPETNKMDFFFIDGSYKELLKSGSFGILEPDFNESRKVEINYLIEKSEEKILILFPGRAFTLDGKRLGRGKGFYDIYFSEFSNKRDRVKCAGVCFSQQIFDDLIVTELDLKMDFVFTDL